MNWKTLGNNIREKRESLGFTQDYLASELKLKRQAIISIEAGKRKVDSFELFKLADLLGVGIEELIFGKAETPTDLDEVISQIGNEDTKKALLEFKAICDDCQWLLSL